MSDLELLGSDLMRRAGAQEALRRRRDERAIEATGLRQRAEELDLAVAVLQALQAEWKEGFERAVGEVVSQGVEGVFGRGVQVLCDLGTSGDLPVARFRVKNPDGLETDILEADGGGLVNVTAFLLRVLLLLSARPPLRRLLVLDESLNNVSEENVPAVVALLRRIVEDGGFQIILISHRESLAEAADVSYRFVFSDGRTKIESQARSGVAEGREDGVSSMREQRGSARGAEPAH